MKKLKVNSSYDNRKINILNIEFEDDEKLNNNSTHKNSLNNSKVIKKTYINSSRIKNKNNINNTNYNNLTQIESNKINPISNFNKENQKQEGHKKVLNIKSNKSSKKNMLESAEIKKSDIELNKSVYKDKSCKNWDEITNNFIQHMQNEQIFKKLDNDNLNKKYFNNKRNFYFGRQKISNLPYVYDISSTYMNNYYNKSEHKRHEILIDELCKLRAYLLKYPNNNNIEIIKDFLMKNNIQNLEKYSNFDLLQLEKFVCQEDIYKINSLLKPYLHVKDMIYDILENSIALNNKFSGFKFNTSIDKLLNKINIGKNNENNKNNKNNKNYNSSSKIYDKFNKNGTNTFLNVKNSTIFENKSKYYRNNNKKFYISELDYSINSNDNNDSFVNSLIEKNNNNEEDDEEKCEEIKNKNHKEFISYSKKRKELLDSIGIYINRKPYLNNNVKDLYSSPLLKKNKKHYYKKEFNNSKMYKNNINYLQLPKINNKMIPYYKPNKLLLAPDKNYSSNFHLLLKDISNELKDFENVYHQKLDMIGNRNSSQNNSRILNSQNKNNIKTLNHSQSCKLFDNNDIERIKKMEAINRLYYGKKSIKIDLNDIQKKHKLTEYIALANAKTHIKNYIINDNVLK